ncbi:L,D-transpeptidase [Shinella fusca]|jgi:lipoprotein-anchoring transpeptidase ErfK/SrfK|uniref:Lipoprotein-anchoring transpeptidase ErfK/SrfK n=1 Tax=Shinella fusca TaxID=544480 RepID=A0A7W8DSJ4_9HYPH|nr:L,D-transpeptidase [Shinella fusca]MBB5040743.1 lipoprotein-anchoring transpeptidase ErfK/SrfK [Shinella fusca]
MRVLIAAAAALLLGAFQAETASAASLVAQVSLSSQTMVVKENGIVKYRWHVSTGRKGYSTPTGSWKAKWASRNHRSRKYDNAPMPYAIFFNGGYAVHATFDTRRLGRPASHGCVRLHPENAATFFQMANRYGLSNTKVVISR